MPAVPFHGILLSMKDVHETDRLCTIFSPDEGRVTMLAKGARRITSRKAGTLQLFSEIKGIKYEARSTPLLNEAITLTTPKALRSDTDLQAYAHYMAEVLIKFLPASEPLPQLFTLLQESLAALNTRQRPQLLLARFIVRFLENQGYAPLLTNCQECGESFQIQAPYFDYREGAFVCESDRTPTTEPIRVRILKTLHFLSTSSVVDMMKVSLTEPDAREALLLANNFLSARYQVEVNAYSFLNATNP